MKAFLPNEFHQAPRSGAEGRKHFAPLGSCHAMRKRHPSKLDRHAEELLAMDQERKTLADMLDWLRATGVTVSKSVLSDFLAKRRPSQTRKEQPSKLDSYAVGLLAMENEEKTLDEMLFWLREGGVSVAKSTLSEFLARRRKVHAGIDYQI